VIHIERDGKLEIIKQVVSHFLIVKSILVYFKVPRFALLTFKTTKIILLLLSTIIMSDNTDATMKSVKVQTFNGKKDAVQTWWIRFKAFANAYGFLPALSAKAEKDLPTTENNEVEINVDQQAAVKRNNMAVY
jgi:hypothetical protein